MGKYLTDDELISTINHSSDPYIIVEGPDDVKIYRWLLEDSGLTAFLEPRNGCGGVKKIYERRTELTNAKVIFICDRDTLVYTGTISEEYEDIIYTTGYSIENDLYQGKAIEKQLFEPKDAEIFERALVSFLRYYACELEKFRRAERCNFHEKPEAIISHEDYSLLVHQLTTFNEPSEDTIKYLKSDYDILLRGHSLFKLVGMVLRRKDRDPKYSESALYEICYKFCKSESIKKLQVEIERRIR